MGGNQTTDDGYGGKQQPGECFGVKGSATEIQGSGGTVVKPYFPVEEPNDQSYGGNDVVYGTPMDRSTVEIPWTTGLFSCHEHWKNAIVTAFLPCVTFGQIAEIIDEGETSSAKAGFLCCMTANMPWCGRFKGCKYRTRLRKKYNLEKPFGDSASHIFFPLCSLCQEFRELKNRGLDPSLGWKKASLDAQHQNQDKLTVPPKNQSMCK